MGAKKPSFFAEHLPFQRIGICYLSNVWRWIVILWHAFWVGSGSLTAWALAEEAFPFHLSLARAAGAAAGAIIALVLPRLLVRVLVESPAVEPEPGVQILCPAASVSGPERQRQQRNQERWVMSPEKHQLGGGGWGGSHTGVLPLRLLQSPGQHHGQR